jgi:hypothetical protein
VKIKRYKFLQPGHYDASSGPLDLTIEDVRDAVDSVNIKAMLGVPVALKYTHQTGLNGASTITTGTARNAVIDSLGNAFWDMDVSMDAEFDGVVLATVDKMVAGLENKSMQGSIEGSPNYQNRAYTKGKTFRLWIKAWAILPGGQQPAVPPNIAADEESDKVIWLMLNDAPEGVESPDRKGADVTIEELSAKLDKLAATVAGLVDGMKQKEASDDDKGKDSEAVKAAEATSADAVKAAGEAVVIARDLMVARKPEGQREKVLAFVELGESPSAKMLRMKQIDELVPDLELPDGATLKAGEAAPEKGGEEATDEQKAIIAAAEDVKAAKVIMREKNVDYSTAISMVDAEKG